MCKCIRPVADNAAYWKVWFYYSWPTGFHKVTLNRFKCDERLQGNKYPCDETFAKGRLSCNLFMFTFYAGGAFQNNAQECRTWRTCFTASDWSKTASPRPPDFMECSRNQLPQILSFPDCIISVECGVRTDRCCFLWLWTILIITHYELIWMCKVMFVLILVLYFYNWFFLRSL